jgi:hypothetical protein
MLASRPLTASVIRTANSSGTTMTYLDQWKALSSRIRGLMEAGHLHAQYLAVRSSDTYGRGKRLREQGERILAALRAFRDSFQQVLPPPAVTAIDDFVGRTSTLINDTTGTPDSLQERVWAALVLLAAFETEMSFLLSDVQESIRARSERAFSHLQRSIVVDEDVRAKWKRAFDDGEAACEKLGAVHLLLHGIWAFKVDAAGARTDLVFQEPAGDFIAAQRYADGFVLTEWKKPAEDSQSDQRFNEARLQARRYAQGPLAATELTGYRYAVVVTRLQVEIPEDLREGAIMYRHVNVAVASRVPSRA